ncbi:DUF2500 family protein [Morganella morganii]|uniref:DUF2500 family protein n=1 Tax=Morganella morganii TaxID=582 RepID=UPI003D9AB4E8
MNKFGLLGFIVAALIIILATRRFFEQRKQNEIDDHSAVVTYQVTVTEKKDYPYPNMRSRERDVVFPETFRYEVHFTPLSGKPLWCTSKRMNIKRLPCIHAERCQCRGRGLSVMSRCADQGLS